LIHKLAWFFGSITTLCIIFGVAWAFGLAGAMTLFGLVIAGHIVYRVVKGKWFEY